MAGTHSKAAPKFTRKAASEATHKRIENARETVQAADDAEVVAEELANRIREPEEPGSKDVSLCVDEITEILSGKRGEIAREAAKATLRQEMTRPDHRVSELQTSSASADSPRGPLAGSTRGALYAPWRPHAARINAEHEAAWPPRSEEDVARWVDLSFSELYTLDDFARRFEQHPFSDLTMQGAVESLVHEMLGVLDACVSALSLDHPATSEVLCAQDAVQGIEDFMNAAMDDDRLRLSKAAVGKVLFELVVEAGKAFDRALVALGHEELISSYTDDPSHDPNRPRKREHTDASADTECSMAENTEGQPPRIDAGTTVTQQQ
jgi:hypothetical protein